MSKLYSGTAKRYTKRNAEKVSRPFKPDTETTLAEQVATWHQEVERINEAKAQAKVKRDLSRQQYGGRGLRRELTALGVTFDNDGNLVPSE
jgi:SOS response regulatory protein OraA/RecX